MNEPSRNGRLACHRELADTYQLCTVLRRSAIAAFIFAGSIVLFGLSVLIAALNSGPGEFNFLGPVAAIAVMLIITRVLVFAAVVLETVGFGFCSATPPRSGARGLGITTMVLALAHLLLDFIYFISVLSGGIGAGRGDPDALFFAMGRMSALLILQLVSWLLFLGYRFIFLLFLRAVAVALRATTLAQNLIYLIILYGVLILLGVVFVTVSTVGGFAADRNAALVGMLLGFILLLVGLGWLSWYLVLLFQCRAALARSGSRA